jgi:hypothetical protein
MTDTTKTSAVRWILYLALASSLVGGVVWASTRQQEAGTEDQQEEFVPTEKVPADHSVSFPVDI